MAYRRSSITARVKLFYQHQRPLTPSFPHIHRHGTDAEDSQTKSISRNFLPCNYIPHRFLGTGNHFSISQPSMNFVGHGLVSGRSFSSSSVGEGAAEHIEIFSGTVQAAAAEVAPVASEVAVAAADSFFPVAAIQYLIDYVHCYTGFNWWASIAVATVLVRSFLIPFCIYELKACSKYNSSSLIREMKAMLQNKDPQAPDVARALKLRNEFYLPVLNSRLLSGAIYCSFFFALCNMADKVPSFKEGGILWFNDLTTPDRMFLFPILMGLTLFYSAKKPFPRFEKDGTEVNTLLNFMIHDIKAYPALSIPLLVFLPKALCCHWITSRLFTMAYKFVIGKPEVQKFLGLSIARPPTHQKPKALGNKMR